MKNDKQKQDSSCFGHGFVKPLLSATERGQEGQFAPGSKGPHN